MLQTFSMYSSLFAATAMTFSEKTVSDIAGYNFGSHKILRKLSEFLIDCLYGKTR